MTLLTEVSDPEMAWSMPSMGPAQKWQVGDGDGDGDGDCL